MSPAGAYVHLLSRELGVDFSQSQALRKMLEPLGEGALADRTQENALRYELYRRFTGRALERATGEGGRDYWRLLRPNGHYTRWHREPAQAINDMVANSSLSFMPFGQDPAAPYRLLGPGAVPEAGKVGVGELPFSVYDQLCTVALRDSARSWLEQAPSAQPGFELGQLRHYYYTEGPRGKPSFLLQEGMKAPSGSLTLDARSFVTPLQMAQSRFRTYWWRQLTSGLLPAEQAGAELVRLGLLDEAENQRIMDIAQPLLMPKRRDVPLRFTPPPNTQGRNRILAARLGDFTMRYFLAQMDELPLPPSAREWYRLAPLCPGADVAERVGKRLSLAQGGLEVISYANRQAARALRELAPGVEELRRLMAGGELRGSSLMPYLHSALGINPRLNLEQAWCMNHSGAGAFMAAGEAFWLMLQEPMEGWKVMDDVDRAALRGYVAELCRTEPTAESMEAEGRGETPDYVLDSLQNLADVLRDYPDLHHYDLAAETDRRLVRHLELVPHPLLEETPDVSWSEPEYEPLPIYSGGSMGEGYRLDQPGELPESLRDDPRVMPALHLLGALRSFPGSRPFARREGIQWKGQLYGDLFGARPRGLEDGWEVCQPFAGLMDCLAKVDALRRSLPSGEKPTFLDERLAGLAGGVLGDMAPLGNITLYRSWDNPAHICRLMPGELNAAEAEARAPYVTHSLGGIYMRQKSALRAEVDIPRSFDPLESFYAHKPRFGMTRTVEQLGRQTISHTLELTLASVLSPGGDAPDPGPGLRELLLRLSEDTGFSERMRKLELHEYTYGQIMALKLLREMLLSVCGQYPEAAYGRLFALCKRLNRSAETRGAVLRAFAGAAIDSYRSGKALYEPPQSAPKEKKRQKAAALEVKNIDREHLRNWEARQEKDRLERADIWLEREEGEGDWGYINDDVRPDGYSRGFFDD